jgi:predicted MPP superfamily phosphohydrolase
MAKVGQRKRHCFVGRLPMSIGSRCNISLITALCPFSNFFASVAAQIDFCFSRLLFCRQPRFVVVCGDLVDASPDKPQWQEAQVKTFKDVMATVDESIPLVCLCGNHGKPSATRQLISLSFISPPLLSVLAKMWETPQPERR